MDKLSAEQIGQIFSVVPNVLRKLASERNIYKEQAEELLREKEATKVAKVMHEKGVRLDTTFDDLVEEMKVAAANGRLDVIKEAVDMQGPNMSTKLASLGSLPSQASSGEMPSNDSEKMLFAYLLNGGS